MRHSNSLLIRTATAAAVLAAAATGVVFLRSTATPTAPTKAVTAAPATRSTLAGVAGSYEAVLQSVAKFEGTDGAFLTLAARGQLDLQDTGGATPALAFRFDGGFSELKGSAVENLSNGVRHDLDGQLGRPFFAQYERSGALNGLQVSPRQSELVLQVQRFIAGVLQLSEGPTQPIWEAAERDTAGHYLASYERCGPGCLKRKKIRYTETAHNRASVEVQESETTFHFDSSSLAELSSHEVVRSRALGAMNLVVETTFTLRAAKAIAKPVPPPASDSVSVSVDGSASPVARDDVLIGGRTASTVMANLANFNEARAKAPLSPELKAAEGREYLAMKALLRKDASAVSAARDHVLAHGAQSDEYIAALRDAGNPESQGALREIMTAPAVQKQARFEATRALSLVDKPTQESVAALEAARSDEALRQQATYGLGSAAYRSKDSNPALASQALHTLVNTLSSESDPYRRATVLKALGNAGMPEALPTIAQSLTSSSSVVRSAAAESLRRIEGSDSDALLLRALGDTGQQVRAEAARALGEHHPNQAIIAALTRAALSDTETGVRTQIALSLVQWARAGAPVQSVLKTIASADPDQRVRQLVANALPGLAKR